MRRLETVYPGQQPWLLVQKYANLHAFNIKNHFLRSAEGIEFSKKVDQIVDKTGASPYFRPFIEEAMQGSDAHFMEFFHNLKGYFVSGIKELQAKPFNVPDIIYAILTPQDHKAWRELDTLNTLHGPLVVAANKLSVAVTTNKALSEEGVHRFIVIEKLRQVSLHFWHHVSGSRSNELSYHVLSLVDDYNSLRQLRQDVVFIGSKDLEQLYSECYAIVKKETLKYSEHCPKLPKRSAASVILPAVSAGKYKEWLDRRRLQRSPTAARLRNRYMHRLLDMADGSPPSPSSPIKARWDDAMKECKSSVSFGEEDYSGSPLGSDDPSSCGFGYSLLLK